MAAYGSRYGRLGRNAWCVVWHISTSIALLASPHCAAADAALESDVKAAFLLNFTKFIEWPPAAFTEANSPFTICIVGSDPFGRVLDDLLAGESAGGRSLTVRRIAGVSEAQGCQIVYAGPDTKELPKTLRSLGPGVLTVGEGDGFVRTGGIIGFVIDNRRVRFDINQSAADSAGLKLSSKLLNVARTVRK